MGNIVHVHICLLVAWLLLMQSQYFYVDLFDLLILVDFIFLMWSFLEQNLTENKIIHLKIFGSSGHGLTCFGSLHFWNIRYQIHIFWGIKSLSQSAGPIPEHNSAQAWIDPYLILNSIGKNKTAVFRLFDFKPIFLPRNVITALSMLALTSISQTCFYFYCIKSVFLIFDEGIRTEGKLFSF